MRKRIITLLAAAGLAIVSGTAAARVDVGISFGIPAPVYVAPPPVVYYPRPVYVAPPPVYYAPAPVYYSEPVYYYGPPRHRRHWHGHHHRRW